MKRNNALKEMEEKDKVILEMRLNYKVLKEKNVCELKH